jgi:hypothetical protein
MEGLRCNVRLIINIIIIIIVSPRLNCQVKQVFLLKLGKGKHFIIAGCMVEKGVITRGRIQKDFIKNIA